VAMPNVYASDDRAVRTSALRKLVPDAVLTLHPTTAASLGLVAGSKATVRTASGAATLPVALHEGVAPGVLAVPHRFPGVPALALPATATVEVA